MQLQNGQIEHYQVRSIDVIHQSEQGFLAQSGLYLLTCYPFDSLASGMSLGYWYRLINYRRLRQLSAL